MPTIRAHLVDPSGNIVNDAGITVSVQQNEWLQGYKEVAAIRPNSEGLISYEATSFTQYRLSASGTDWNTSEQLVDTGADIFVPIDVTLTMDKKLIPIPTINPTSWFRDIGLAQAGTILLVLFAVAAIVVAAAYGTSKIAPTINTGSKIAARHVK